MLLRGLCARAWASRPALAASPRDVEALCVRSLCASGSCAREFVGVGVDWSGGLDSGRVRRVSDREAPSGDGFVRRARASPCLRSDASRGGFGGVGLSGAARSRAPLARWAWTACVEAPPGSVLRIREAPGVRASVSLSSASTSHTAVELRGDGEAAVTVAPDPSELGGAVIQVLVTAVERGADDGEAEKGTTKEEEKKEESKGDEGKEAPFSSLSSPSSSSLPSSPSSSSLPSSPSSSSSNCVVVSGLMPSRYTSLDVEVSGSVSLRGLQEARLDVRSCGGGDVDVGKTKATYARVQTCGGAVRGSLTAAEVEVRTGGGRLAMGRLAGLDVLASSDGGDVDVETLYADRAVVDSDGGNLRVGAARSADGAALRSRGGAVDVGALDGAVHVDAGGGPVRLHAQRAATSVDVVSPDGDVILTLAPELDVDLDVVAGTLLQLPPPPTAAERGGMGGGGRGGTALQSLSAPGGGFAAIGDARDATKAAAAVPVVVDVGERGTVRAERKTWMDLMRAKFQAANK